MDVMNKPIPWNSRLCHVVNLEMLSFYCRHLCVLGNTAAGQCFSWCISNLAFKAAQQHSESSYGVFRHHANWKSGQSLCKGQIYHHAWLYYYYSLCFCWQFFLLTSFVKFMFHKSIKLYLYSTHQTIQMHFKVTQKRDSKAKKGFEAKKHLQTKAHHEDIKVNKNVNLKTLRCKIYKSLKMPQVLYKMIKITIKFQFKRKS